MNCKDEPEKIRILNLVTFVECVDKFSIDYCLFERTLLYLYNVSQLSKDRTDQVAIHVKQISSLSLLHEELISKGFEVIKATADEIWIIKQGRALEVKLFYCNANRCKTVKYKIGSKLFHDMNTINICGVEFNVPNNTEELLEYLYYPTVIEVIRRLSVILFSNEYSAKQTWQFVKTIILSQSILKDIVFRKKHIVNTISLSEFREIYFDIDEVNMVMRKNHMDIINNNGEYKTIGEIVDYLSNGRLFDLSTRVIETDTSKIFNQPIYWSKQFWKTGNNYYINSIRAEFRSDVVPYENANNYITEKLQPNIYTNEYYESLDLMKEKNILSMLKDHPIEIKNNTIIGGRHRVCAMIGRIISGKNYIPFYVRYNK